MCWSQCAGDSTGAVHSVGSVLATVQESADDGIGSHKCKDYCRGTRDADTEKCNLENLGKRATETKENKRCCFKIY